MEIHIKNMVCDRCLLAVHTVLRDLGIEAIEVRLGQVRLVHALSENKHEALKVALEKLGFALLEDKKSQLMEQIKAVIIDLVQKQNGGLQTNLSNYLSQKLHQDYNYISNMFSEAEGTTIEKYFIVQKIEKVKELLEYGELSLGEIAFQMQYSSVAYLSNQFKKTTGMTTTTFKKLSHAKRTALDQL